LQEDKIIDQEVRTLKMKMAAKDVTPKKMKEFIVRMIYCEMLGHDADFGMHVLQLYMPPFLWVLVASVELHALTRMWKIGHIHTVNLTSSSTLVEKRVGYLGLPLSLLLRPRSSCFPSSPPSVYLAAFAAHASARV
jgi:AP-4 complex subunit epsilon-1